MVLLSACCPDHRVCRDDIPISNLFVYRKADLEGYLKSQGYSNEYLFKVERNSLGSSLYFHQRGSEETNGSVLIVTAKGIQKHLKKPGLVAFLNDAGEFVAWTNDYRKGVQLKGNYFLTLANYATFGVDPSGDYYFLESSPSFTEIFRTRAPGIPIASSNLRGQRIYFKNDKLYLFASHQRNVHGPGDYEIFEIIGHVFRRGDQKFILDQTITIPRPKPHGASPFSVVDMDPHSDEILVLDVSDPPSRSTWYVYNAPTQKLTKAGIAKYYAFFLTADIAK